MAPADSTRLGLLTVFHPQPSLPHYWFTVDLAELLHLEFTSEAVALLRTRMKSAVDRPPGRLSLDSEADALFVQAAKVEPIVWVARLIHELVGEPLPAGEADAASALLRAAVKRRRQKWGLGSVFEVPLGDDTVAFGQVVDKRPSGAATLALFEVRQTAQAVPEDVDRICKSPLLSVLHTSGASLDDGEFRVFGDAPPVCAVDAGAWGKPGPHVGARSTSDRALRTLARAWWGLDVWDEASAGRLMPGRSRPPGL